MAGWKLDWVSTTETLLRMETRNPLHKLCELTPEAGLFVKHTYHDMSDGLGL